MPAAHDVASCSLNADIQDFRLEFVVVQDFELVLSFPTTTSFKDLGSKPKIVNPLVLVLRTNPYLCN